MVILLRMRCGLMALEGRIQGHLETTVRLLIATLDICCCYVTVKSCASWGF